MVRNRFIASIALISFVSGSALADDLTPPPWRFAAGTTVQHWDFSSGPTGFFPDALPLNNTFGTPVMTPSLGSVWQPAFAGRPHVWDITGGGLNFDIPNTGVATHQKELWVQVTYFGLPPAGGPGITVGSTAGPFTMIGLPTTTPLPNGWFHELSKWSIPVCPQSERVAIFPGLVGVPLVLDQVVIDTQCFVPTPGAASVLALGGLCAMRRRRRAAIA